MAESVAVRIPVRPDVVEADLVLPPNPRGLVIFAHGSGSSRHSPRNQMVAGALQQAGLATLLLDLLTPREEQLDQLTHQQRFDIALLARRLEAALDWAREDPRTAALPVGLFGASTGAAAALVAAARRPEQVLAVVSRGGRVDMAGESLGLVQAPVLMLVGDQDETVLNLNQQAAKRLLCTWKLIPVAGATHLFEERGTLQIVAQQALAWFLKALA